ARKMVCEWGMSADMGPLTFGKQDENIFLGKEFSRHQDYSEATAVRIDEEISLFVTLAYRDSKEVLEAQQASLNAISNALLEKEVLDGEEIYDLIEEHSDIDVQALKPKKNADASEEVQTT
ncbi:MAG: cell division protein FtsH, partial [Acidobacteriota bacterium]